jgi:nucleoside-diphosphate-sugar epimerase
MTVFVAGATGAIGHRLVPMLVAAGHRVFGMTRAHGPRADALLDSGAIPVIADVFDAQSLAKVVRATLPEVVIHQLTDLPAGLDPSQMDEAIRRNARIRSEGTANLVTAAREAGVKRMVAQSVAWLYAPGTEPHGEDDPLDTAATGSRQVSVGGIGALERAVLSAQGMAGVVLRYGRIWGPGTGSDSPEGNPLPLHVDEAARAVLLAMGDVPAGIYNIVGPNDSVSGEKAHRVLGMSPG